MRRSSRSILVSFPLKVLFNREIKASCSCSLARRPSMHSSRLRIECFNSEISCATSITAMVLFFDIDDDRSADVSIPSSSSSSAVAMVSFGMIISSAASCSSSASSFCSCPNTRIPGSPPPIEELSSSLSSSFASLFLAAGGDWGVVVEATAAHFNAKEFVICSAASESTSEMETLVLLLESSFLFSLAICSNSSRRSFSTSSSACRDAIVSFLATSIC
mmetsp:Transcript_13101/g.31016  ORF Transcript_13101/g.31016 Transcript_13101/m.31016 type:complete len:219 (-) Transcript_13101:1234-1890(-)